VVVTPSTEVPCVQQTTVTPATPVSPLSCRPSLFLSTAHNRERGRLGDETRVDRQVGLTRVSVTGAVMPVVWLAFESIAVLVPADWTVSCHPSAG